jgi:hypothetical protein
VEEVLWETVQRAITGELEIDPALRYMREQIRKIVGDENGSYENADKEKELSFQGGLSRS